MAVKASDNYKVYENPNGPKVSTVTRKIIEKDGLYFKDIDGTGEVSKVNDWRLPAAERAEAYVKTLTLEEKRTFWLNIINQIYVENGEIKEVMVISPASFINLQTSAIRRIFSILSFSEKSRFLLSINNKNR